MVAFPPSFHRTPAEDRDYGRRFWRSTASGTAPPTIHQSVGEIERQVRQVNGASDLVIEADLRKGIQGGFLSNQRAPADPGVVVRFKRHGKPFAVPCDKFRSIEANLRAVALMLEASRLMERYGFEIFEEEFRGYAALPPGSGESYGVIFQDPPPHEVLAVAPDAPAEVVRAAWRVLAAKHHPDRGGDGEAFKRVTRARDALLKQQEATV